MPVAREDNSLVSFIPSAAPAMPLHLYFFVSEAHVHAKWQKT